MKTWYLGRLKNLGASESTLKEIYVLFIRQALEFAAPLWTSSLSKQNIDNLEKLQHYATNLICGQNRLTYEQRLDKLSLPSLEERRWQITARFGEKLSCDPDFQHLFRLRNTRETRSACKFTEPKAFTKGYTTSPIPTFIKLITRNKTNINRPNKFKVQEAYSCPSINKF